MEKLEILVVDDLYENRVTAREYFASVGINVDLAVNYETGKEKIEQRDYYFTILDLQMPYDDEEKMGEYGFELEKIANKYAIPAVVLTGKPMGKGHHGSGSSILIGGLMLGSTPIKTEIEAWKKTHETIEEIFNSELIQKAKEQYTNVTGIRFQNRKPTF